MCLSKQGETWEATQESRVTRTMLTVNQRHICVSWLPSLWVCLVFRLHRQGQLAKCDVIIIQSEVWIAATGRHSLYLGYTMTQGKQTLDKTQLSRLCSSTDKKKSTTINIFCPVQLKLLINEYLGIKNINSISVMCEGWCVMHWNKWRHRKHVCHIAVAFKLEFLRHSLHSGANEHLTARERRNSHQHIHEARGGKCHYAHNYAFIVETSEC